MPHAFTLQINGRSVDLPLTAPVYLDRLIAHLAMRDDRIAVELNGTIIPRTAWPHTPVASASKLEIVHFVGGGNAE